MHPELIKQLVSDLPLEDYRNQLADNIDTICTDFLNSQLEKIPQEERPEKTAFFGFMEDQKAYIMHVGINSNFEITKKIGLYPLKEAIMGLNPGNIINKFL